MLRFQANSNNSWISHEVCFKELNEAILAPIGYFYTFVIIYRSVTYRAVHLSSMPQRWRGHRQRQTAVGNHLPESQRARFHPGLNGRHHGLTGQPGCPQPGRRQFLQPVTGRAPAQSQPVHRRASSQRPGAIPTALNALNALNPKQGFRGLHKAPLNGPSPSIKTLPAPLPIR